MENKLSLLKCCIVTSVLFMILCCILRLLGIDWFQHVITEDHSYNIIVYFVCMSIYHIIEGFLILSILTNNKWYINIIISIVYDLLLYLFVNKSLCFALDLIFIISIPFVFNEDKKKSIINSSLFILLISLYQMFMIFGRYNIEVDKTNLFHQILSTVDYKVFLLTILLFKKGKRYNE